MKIEEALNYADEWAKGQTFYEGMQGWRVVCAVLAAEVRRLRENMTQLMTGLECKGIGFALDEINAESFKLLGEKIAQRAKANTDYSGAEPDAVPVGYVSNGGIELLQEGELAHISGKRREIWTNAVYTSPPRQIDDETKRLVLELCGNIRKFVGGNLATDARAIMEKLGAGDE